MQVLAALAAIAVEMPTTTHSLFYHNIPQLSLGGFVPCPDASAWVIESVAFALVVVNTAYRRIVIVTQNWGVIGTRTGLRRLKWSQRVPQCDACA